MDLCWDYNNVWIKKRDEWKAVFTILKESFEPMVMFFRLTNSSVTFHTIINKIFQNLINTGKVASFIDDVIVEEVVRRLTENDLYIKPEKYKWKIRKVEFLGVVIKLEGIKMKDVLDWLTLKEVKDVQKLLGLVNYYHQRFHRNSQTIIWYSEKGSEVGLDREAREGIQRIKREVYKRASVNSIRFRQKNEDGSRYVRLCNGRDIIYGIWEWKMVISSFSLKISKWDRDQL